MSDPELANTNGRQAKRRKKAHDRDADDRFELEPSSAPGSEDSESEEEKPVPSSRPTRSRRPQKSNTHTLVPTGGLNKSSILSIQLDELLAENNTPNYDVRMEYMAPDIQRVQQLIRQVPRVGPLSLEDAEAVVQKDGATIPFPSPKPNTDTKLKFEYDSPITVEPRSALHMSVGIKGPELVKVVAEMPQHLFHAKDYLNYRAFHKRAFYLTCIAAFIKKEASDEFKLHYAPDDGVDLLPGIILTPAAGSAADENRKRLGHILFVTVSFPEGVFPVEKTLPTKNCLRAKAGPESTETQPTPYYNSVLNSQARIRHYFELYQRTDQRTSSFASACQAGHIWLRQRGFDSTVASGGFGFWEWTMVSALLMRTGGYKGHPLFSQRYSNVQFFKALLQVLSGRDMTDPWVLNAHNLTLPRVDTPTLYDGNTGVNLLQKMTPWSYQMLRHHAQISLASLNSKQDDSFEVTFYMRVAEPHLEFDEIYVVPISELSSLPSETQEENLFRLYRVLKRGLGDRVKLVDLKCPPHIPWSATKLRPSPKRDSIVEVRLLLNMDATPRLIDHGPPANDQEAAAEFQRFWGEKSELRRFKDGSISESLVWSASEPVTLQIIRHLLSRHFQASESSIDSKSPRLEEKCLDTNSPTTATEAFKLINNHFQTLSSTLHQLEGLPLPIRSISPADPALRSTTLTHPLHPSPASPISILIQFDSSTRWPDSLPAIQHTQIAFLLKLADLLSTSDSTLHTRVGLENTSSQHSGYLNTSYLDIIYPQPHPQLSHICFRLRIQHDRDLALLQSQLSKSLPPNERTALTAALTTHKRLLASPQHTSALRSLTTRFPPLSPTIRLLKSFLSAHHLTHLLPQELPDLIAAHIFAHPSPWSTPGSASTAFLRSLHFLSRWDWQMTPLIIDLSLSQDMPDATRDELRARFEAWRKLDPQMNSVSWFVGSNVDTSGVVWTEGGRVEKVVAARVQALAQAAVKVVSEKKKGTGMTQGDWDNLFVSGVEEFDFVVKVKRSVVRSVGAGAGAAVGVGKKKKHEKEKEKFKNLQIAKLNLSTEEIGFDPLALYLADLEKAFGHIALFFYGEGQDVICGLWRPHVSGAEGGKEKQREWRVRLGWSSVPLKDIDDGKAKGSGAGSKVLCKINKEGILAEMGMLGEGLVREISVNGKT